MKIKTCIVHNIGAHLVTTLLTVSVKVNNRAGVLERRFRKPTVIVVVMEDSRLMEIQHSRWTDPGHRRAKLLEQHPGKWHWTNGMQLRHVKAL